MVVGPELPDCGAGFGSGGRLAGVEQHPTYFLWSPTTMSVML